MAVAVSESTRTQILTAAFRRFVPKIFTSRLQEPLPRAPKTYACAICYGAVRPVGLHSNSWRCFARIANCAVRIDHHRAHKVANELVVVGVRCDLGQRFPSLLER